MESSTSSTSSDEGGKNRGEGEQDTVQSTYCTINCPSLNEVQYGTTCDVRGTRCPYLSIYLSSYLLEGTLGEEVSFDAAERFVRVVVGLLDQSELLSLYSVESGVDAVVFLKPLQR